jgi:hypothetical protein
MKMNAAEIKHATTEDTADTEEQIGLIPCVLCVLRGGEYFRVT